MSRRRAVKGDAVAPGGGLVSTMSISAYAQDKMGVYAEEVNLDRSVPDLYDGLKPVQRRIMWEGYLQRAGGFVKTARLVGGVIGRWHPHGDAGVDGAIETMVHHNVPTMLGKGNWGGLLDTAAAMRYTNCKLSNYGLQFFGSDYIVKAVTDFVPNYDDTEHEPVTLPAMLPNVLLNGGEGIGVGLTTVIPTFTPESLVAALQLYLSGKKPTALELAKTMKFATRWGGRLINSKENRSQYLSLFTSASARLMFEAELVVDRDNKCVMIDDWPPGLSVPGFIKKARAIKGVTTVFNHEGDTGFCVEVDKGYNYTQFDQVVERLKKLAISSKSYRINVTQRQLETVDGKPVIKNAILSMSIPMLLKAWLRRRLILEKRSLEYRMLRQEEAIAYSKLLIYAASKLDIVFAALKSKDSSAHLVKHMKITADQAKQILDLRVRQLSKLDKEAMETQLKEQLAHQTQLKRWYANPKAKVSADLDAVLKTIGKDQDFEADKGQKLEVA